MIGDGYILKIAESTKREILLGMSAYLCKRLLGREGERSAGMIAGCTSMYLFGEPPDNEEFLRFHRQNESRIRREAEGLAKERDLSGLLSGAAYNMGYGIYVATGGGSLMNRCLGYMRMENAINNRFDVEQFQKMAVELEAKHPHCLRAVSSLKRLGIWNPAQTVQTSLNTIGRSMSLLKGWEHFSSIFHFRKMEFVPKLYIAIMRADSQ
jgi:hypothetical protein